MQFTHSRHGRRIRSSNRFGGDKPNEILDSWSFPRHVGREKADRERMRIELAEQVADWRNCCAKPVQPLPVNGALQAVLVWPKPSQNGTVRVSRNGTRREPIVPQTWYRRGPATPSWL